MFDFGMWGDPYASEPHRFAIGEKARVKMSVPTHTGRVGRVVDVEHGVLLEFPDGARMEYDDDMLIPVKDKGSDDAKTL